MYNIYRLLKNYLLNFLGSFLKKQKSPKFYIAIIFCVLFTILIIFAFTLNAISSIEIFLDQDVDNPELLSMFSTSTLALMMLLFVTIMRSVYPSKGGDNDLLLSMPISKLEIVLAKGIYNYLFDLVIFISVLMPSYIVFFVMVPGATYYVIIRGVMLVLILPLISNAVATFIGIVCDKLSRKLRFYSIVQTIVSISLIGIYLILNYSLQNYLMTATGNAQDIVKSIFVINIVLEFVLNGNGTFFLLILSFAVVVYVASLLYSSLQLGKLRKEYTKKGKKLNYKVNSPLITLTKKELKQYFNMPIYLMNTIITPVLYVGMAIAVSLLGKDIALSFVQTMPESFSVNFDVFVLMLFSILIAGYVITGSSISLEGKRFWIIRANPIKNSTLFLSKIAANLIISFIVIIIGFPFILSFVSMNLWWCFLVVPMFVSLMASILGLIVNLNYPKMEWDKEEAVVKSSLASMISLFFPMILVIIPFIIYLMSFTSIFNPVQFVLLLIGYLFILCVVFVIWLYYKGNNALYNASFK